MLIIMNINSYMSIIIIVINNNNNRSIYYFGKTIFPVVAAGLPLLFALPETKVTIILLVLLFIFILLPNTTI